jgi:methionine-rich copper-binding protein CopC
VHLTGPRRQTLPKSWRLLTVAVLLTLIGGILCPATASAHAELRQASPDRGETVGGAIHSITLQFFDLDLTKPQTAAVFDPAGNELAGQVNREDQRLVIALVEPITTPGEYLVTFAANGIDGDFTEESFSFRWEEGAPEPKGIDITEPVGLDTFNYVLLLIGAALAAFIVHRFMVARREIRAARLAELEPSRS